MTLERIPSGSEGLVKERQFALGPESVAMRLRKAATKRRVTFRPIESKVLGTLTGVLEVRYRRRLLGKVCLMGRRDGTNYWEYRGEGGFDLGAPEMDELEIAKQRLLAQVREWRKGRNRTRLRRVARYLVAGVLAFLIATGYGLLAISSIIPRLLGTAAWIVAAWGIYKGGELLFDKLELNHG